MINLYFICAKWCNSCPAIFENISIYIENLDKSKYNFSKLDIDEDDEIIGELNVEINTLPSLVIIEENNTNIIIQNDINPYFKSMNLTIDDDF